MDESTRRRDATNERSLDPDESWGQGTDASHTETAADDAVPRDVRDDPTLGGDASGNDSDEPEAPPLT